METFYYYERSELHLSNKKLGCSESAYEKLEKKGKISEERLDLLYYLQRYRALTLPMVETITGRGREELREDLKALMEYGLVIKQFYKYMDEEVEDRSVTFYCTSAKLPGSVTLSNKKHDFLWQPDLPIENAMAILAFNQFHLALMNNVPKKVIQAQLQFYIRNDIVDGRYKLKGKKLHLGYSLLFVHAVRDFAKQNTEISQLIERVKHSCMMDGEKAPWFILICENKLQCAYIEKKIKGNPETRDVLVYYLLDTDFSYDENPLLYLQRFRFEDSETRIKTEFFKVEAWY